MRHVSDNIYRLRRKRIAHCPRMVKLIGWVFTYNYPDEVGKEEGERMVHARYQELRGALGTLGIRYIIYALERGEKTGRLHIQGYMQCTCDKKKKIYEKYKVYVDRQRGTVQEATDYVKKDGEYNELGEAEDIPGARQGQGMRQDLEALKRDIEEGKSYDEICDTHFESAAKYSRFIKERIQARDTAVVQNSLLKEYEESSLKPWQQDLVSVVEANPHRRKIHWVWSKQGNLGKSWMATYLGVKHKACVFMGGAKTNLAFIYAQNPTKVVVFDLSRTQEANYLDHLYSLAEDLKNGRLTSTKYESKTIYFPIPHVIFLANFSPDLTKWSEDRYDIKEL